MSSAVDFWEAGRTAKLFGKRISRVCWGQMGMFVVNRQGYPNGVKIDAATAQALGQTTGDTVIFGGYFVIKLADGSVHPWVPSQQDMDAKDWVILDG